MTAHAHRTLVDGCYRCELNRDEVADALADAIAEGWVADEEGNLYGHCNSCGEERQEFEDCCEDGEIVPNDAGQLASSGAADTPGHDDEEGKA